jgi:hypothetical protein
MLLLALCLQISLDEGILGGPSGFPPVRIEDVRVQIKERYFSLTMIDSHY